ncbi:MAG: glycosyltransferase family 4 protein [Candidatus Omnitrophica bacterium]|nr:glycosyltransferase family 4 protein [Candidatus Omnitrophota bacterium]
MRKNVVWLIMDFAPFYTGHGIYIEKLAAYMSKSGYNFTIVTPNHSNKELDKEKRSDYLEVIRIPQRWNKNLKFLEYCVHVVFYLFTKNKYYSIVHAHGFFDKYGIIAFVCKMMHKPCIMQMVLMDADDPIYFMRTYKFANLRLKLFNLFDSFITISSPLTQRCLDAGFSKNVVIQIPQGVDTNKFCPVVNTDKKMKLKKQYGIHPDVKVILFVGAIIERKGIGDLINVWRDIQDKDHKICLLLVGPYDFKDNQDFIETIKKKIEKQRLNVRLIGRVENVEEYMKLSDIFVFPSRLEGFGNVIIEAMACGLPSVVSEMNGVAYDTIDDKNNGYIVKNRTDMKRRILELLRLEETREAFGTSAREKAKKVFDFNIIAYKYQSLYESLLSN